MLSNTFTLFSTIIPYFDSLLHDRCLVIGYKCPIIVSARVCDTTKFQKKKGVPETLTRPS